MPEASGSRCSCAYFMVITFCFKGNNRSGIFIQWESLELVFVGSTQKPPREKFVRGLCCMFAFTSARSRWRILFGAWHTVILKNAWRVCPLPPDHTPVNFTSLVADGLSSQSHGFFTSTLNFLSDFAARGGGGEAARGRVQFESH